MISIELKREGTSAASWFSCCSCMEQVERARFSSLQLGVAVVPAEGGGVMGNMYVLGKGTGLEQINIAMGNKQRAKKGWAA